MLPTSLTRLARRTAISLRENGLVTTARRAELFLRRRVSGNALQPLGSNRHQSPAWDHTYGLSSVDGTVPARRTHREIDYAIKVPFTADPVDTASPVGVFIHAFYVEQFRIILGKLLNIRVAHVLYITTNNEAKKSELEALLASYEMPVFIKIVPNRGRDVAPKLLAFKEAYSQHKIVLHLHTKRSPHSTGLSTWLDYILSDLIGTPEIVESNLSLFSDDKLGILYPQHLPPLRGSLNWGYDYSDVQAILSRVGIKVSKDHLLEFPSGSMFWARSAALMPLVEMNFSFADFPEEAGQIDGTLAHAIERSFCFISEATCRYWLKVSSANDYPWPHTLLKYDPLHPDHSISKVYRPLRADRVLEDGALARTQTSLRPLKPARSQCCRPRLNLLIPSLNNRSFFGGAATALRVFNELRSELKEFDARIIFLDAPIEDPSDDKLRDFTLYEPSVGDGIAAILFDAFDRSEYIPVRDGDIFISTSWWSEYLRRELARFQDVAFGSRARKSIYLIQDYESGFSKWSSAWAIAESTYQLDASCIPIFNSEELYTFFDMRYNVQDGYVIPYELNPAIRGGLTSSVKTRTMLVYGRPSVERNCFEILVDGIAIWQQRNPLLAAQWKIVSVGEEYPASWALPVQGTIVRGKVDLTEYAHLLSIASAGVSLMISPHPSYPPLEMASAGLVTVSNDYDNKKIALRSDSIVSVTSLTPQSLADAVEVAVERAEREIVGHPASLENVNDLDCGGHFYGAQAIASRIV